MTNYNKDDTRIFVYKIVEDSGGAPCVEKNLWSLCLCKPSIRRSAAIGDWIFAFGSKTEEPPNRLVYIAEVTNKIEDGEYYSRREYMGRSDSVYRLTGNEYRLKRGARFHPEGTLFEYDLGEDPDYRNAVALVSDNFRYFGDAGDNEWRHDWKQLWRMVDQLTVGHRVNHKPRIRKELVGLQTAMWKQYRKRTLGQPIHEQPIGCPPTPKLTTTCVRKKPRC